MDSKTIFSKTAKGLREASGASSELSRALRGIIKEIDGKSTLADLQGKLKKMPEAELVAALNGLIASGHIREANATVSQVSTPNSPSEVSPPKTDDGGFDDLDFTALSAAPAPVAADRAVEEEAQRKAQVAARQAAEAKARLEAEQKAKLEAQAKARQEAEAKARAEAAEKAKREAEEKARQLALAKAKQEADEKAKQEALAKAKREAEERARKEAEQKAKQEAEAKAQVEAVARAKKEAEDKARIEAETKAKQEAVAQAKREAEARARQEAEEKARREAEERAKREAEAKAREEAEARARQEAEEKARKAAEEKEKQEALLRARQEAEAKAKQAAEQEARAAAEAKAREETEARARKEAEEKQQRAAEERSRREAEARALKEAEEKARREDEERARHEREEQIRRDAEERARKEAEEKARIEAQEKLRLEAEEKLRRETEEQARRDAAEQARLAAEESARKWEAEQKARQEAEEKARKEAEERTQREAEEKARREEFEQIKREAEEKQRLAAWERAKQKAEEKLKQEAEDKARREAEDRIKIEAKERAAREEEERLKEALKERARQEAEEKALLEKQARIRREAEEELRQEAKEKAEREAREEAARIAIEKAELAASRAKIRWGKLTALVSIPLIAIVLGAIHFISFSGRIPELEKAASAQFQQPVKIDDLHLSLFPPHWRLDGVTIGADAEIKAPRVNAAIDVSGILGGNAFKSIEFVSPELKEQAVGWLFFGKPQGQDLRMAQIRASNASLTSAGIDVPRFDAKADIGADGSWQKIVLEFSNKDVYVELHPDSERVQFEINATTFLPPLGGTLQFDDFAAKGTFTRKELAVSEFSSRNLGGSFSGTTTVKWNGGWSIEGVVNAKQVDAKQLAPALIGTSRVDGKGVFAVQAKAAKLLLASPHVEGNFTAGQGELLGVDLMHMLQNTADSGKTGFRELNGSFVRDGDLTQLRQIRLDAGILSANGSAELETSGAVRGRFATAYRFDNQQKSGTLSLSGTVQAPKFGR